MYADDSSIAAFGNTPKEAETALSTCLNHVAHWFSINRLIINPSKSNIMVVGTKAKTSQAQNLNVKINNISLQQVKHLKTLGVILDENLSFNHHIESLIKKTSSKIAIIHRLRHILPTIALNNIYISFIQSTIDYCLTIYGNSSKQNLSSIQRLQNRAARAVTGDFDYSSSVSGIIKDLGWMNLNQRFSYFLSILVFKCLNNLAPNYLSSSLHYVSENQSYHTRAATYRHLSIPMPNLSIFKHSFKYSGPTLWNSLPSHIIESDSLYTFKKRVKHYLTS